ncbi:MAG TPA: hypothetical protein VNZ53_08505 [Steroidobacteraceae bacterium]|nr:hypothetical protein [Steroidobacteraceae bacterium]
MAVQLAAVLTGGNVEPAPAGAKETALIGEAEQIGRLRQRQIGPAEILLGQLAARIVKQLNEGRLFFFQTCYISLKGGTSN